MVDILTTVFGRAASYGDPNVYSFYLGNEGIGGKDVVRVDLNLSSKRFVFSINDPTRPQEVGEPNGVIFNFLLAAGAKQVPYKKKDGTSGYLNKVLSYADLSKTQIKTMLAALLAKYPNMYYYEGKWHKN